MALLAPGSESSQNFAVLAIVFYIVQSTKILSIWSLILKWQSCPPFSISVLMVTTPLSAPWILLLALESTLTTCVLPPCPFLDGTQEWVQCKDPCSVQENFQMVLTLIWGLILFFPSPSLHWHSTSHCLGSWGWQLTTVLSNGSGMWHGHCSTEVHLLLPIPKGKGGNHKNSSSPGGSMLQQLLHKTNNFDTRCHSENPKDKGTKPWRCLHSSDVLILMGSKCLIGKSVNTFQVSNSQ